MPYRRTRHRRRRHARWLLILILAVPLADYFNWSPEEIRQTLYDLPFSEPAPLRPLLVDKVLVPFPPLPPYGDEFFIDIGSFLGWPGGVMDLWRPTPRELPGFNAEVPNKIVTLFPGPV